MKAIEKRLLALFAGLAAPERDMLVSFAEFLAARAAGVESAEPPAEPRDIPRPEQESVVAAIKRLSETYHMLDKPTLLNEASALMTQHVMQGRDVVEVIDELEAIFQQHYRQWEQR
jgi:hypothetical protein